MAAPDAPKFCIFMPLKLGVAFVATATWVSALFCILALITGDVRLQGNGYNLSTYRLPTIVGVFGVILGFVGLMGVWDSNERYLRWFTRFLLVKIIAMLIAMIFDFAALCWCDGYMFSSLHFSQKTPGHLGLDTLGNNPAIEKLAEQGLCPRARASYALGCVIDLGIWIYFLYVTYYHRSCLENGHGLRFPIEFDSESYKDARWEFFGVKDVRSDAPKRHATKIPKISQEANYGSMAGPGAPDLEGDPGSPEAAGAEPETYDIATYRSGPATQLPPQAQRPGY